ncbi:MAG: Vitamin dependent methionine synthase activation region [Firmicutes bacterium]|nr:Vitamin dependent methionine synthase activation region [Bacillota bacterium]
MPVYNAPLTTLDKNETRRYAGLKGKTEFSDKLLEEACTQALILANPKGVWNNYPYNAATNNVLSQPLYQPLSADLSEHLQNAVEVAILGVTIGEAVEKKVSDLFSSGDYTLALLLDAAATAAVESIADSINSLINTQAAKRGFKTTLRFSPGYGDWNITDQPTVLELAEASKAGIAVTSSCMLIPRKSVTAVIGLVPQESSITRSLCGKPSCKACSQHHCLARKEF